MYTHISVCVFVLIHKLVYMYVYVYGRMYVFKSNMPVCMYTFLHIYTHARWENDGYCLASKELINFPMFIKRPVFRTEIIENTFRNFILLNSI